MFFDSIIKGAPVTVDVAGVVVPINSGFRISLVFSTMQDKTSLMATARTLNLFFAKAGKLPDQVSKHPKEALTAAAAWYSEAFNTMQYGTQYSQRSTHKRTFDWQEDAGILSADFMRFYALDLTSPSTQLHWYTFTNLYMALIATPSSLVNQAIGARSPLTGDITREAERAHARAARAWALLPTENELREMALRNF